MRYSPYPIEAYTCPTPEGRRWGLGALPALVRDKDLWNLFWLSFPNLEQYVGWPASDYQKMPVYSFLLPQCEASIDKPMGGRTVRHFISRLPAREFVDQVLSLGCQDLPLYIEYGASWYGTITRRALQAQAQEQHENVVFVDFGRRA